ncbi:flagellin [Ferrimonas lipolytica]|uniref:Flagellin n=1 Tax=Ferrimonas lipolytica TaxID=2724191 RepID=A0A6H1UE94_9GAMM|nr:flagellin [Ferrimonas lipolytica]QIZ77364.1 flagellin [Ferrimonas lipolytica]
MSISVNSNVTAMSSQNAVNSANSATQTSMERLSSGLRINSAKDDAAGLQISNRLSSQISGMDVAMRNANDGISMAQTAEGAMQESTDILQRMRDLSVQSANGSNSADDRTAIQEEITSLQDELTRISDTTSFGGQSLLDGSYGTQSFQIGSNANETIELSMNDVGADHLAQGRSVSGTSVAVANIDAVIKADDMTFTLTSGDGSAGSTVSVDLSDAEDAGGIAAAMNKALGDSGVSAGVDESGNVVLSGQIENSDDPGTTDSNLVFAGTSVTAAPTLGANDSSSVDTIDVSTTQGAQSAITMIDEAISQIDSQRSELGATQNRMEHTINNLSNIQTNVSDARSRIQDVDFAKESTELAKQQVLSQSSSAMLAQANQLPSAALSLL